MAGQGLPSSSRGQQRRDFNSWDWNGQDTHVLAPTAFSSKGYSDCSNATQHSRSAECRDTWESGNTGNFSFSRCSSETRDVPGMSTSILRSFYSNINAGHTFADLLCHCRQSGSSYAWKWHFRTLIQEYNIYELRDKHCHRRSTLRIPMGLISPRISWAWTLASPSTAPLHCNGDIRYTYSKHYQRHQECSQPSWRKLIFFSMPCRSPEYQHYC